MGTIKLFNDRIEFEKQALRKSQRWKIVIPFSAIDVSQVHFAEKDSGKAIVTGGGFAWPGLFGVDGFGGGLITKFGDLQLLVIPYTDENGIKQAPRFLIKGAIRDKTREWAQVIYEKLAELSRSKSQNVIEAAQEDEIVEKLKKLKELYESGILTEEEYAQKKKELLEKL
ncbi:MAG: SHOCT domain-containing protein [Gammaproteobacteria bacterium]|nr:SHOCT domain-containing protein [Gammaproteobacteria bacterium]